MSIRVIFHGKIEKGRFVVGESDRDRLAKRKASLEGMMCEMTLEKPVKHRSDRQRGYFHAVICKIIGDELGYSIEEAKEAIKWKFLRVPGEAGKPDTVRSTESLTTVEQENLNEEVRRWFLIERNVKIPLPNEVEY